MFGNSVTIQQGLSITVICMAIVFVVLFILALILDNFKYMSVKESQKNTNKKSEVKKPTNCVNENILTDFKTDDDLVAAMAATIAANEGNHKNKIRIKSIKRIK